MINKELEYNHNTSASQIVLNHHRADHVSIADTPQHRQSRSQQEPRHSIPVIGQRARVHVVYSCEEFRRGGHAWGGVIEVVWRCC